uniref:Uncharacterized protein n=1 Tax=Micrurus lemniscatus lemniscatus TaxID=129467 RepID=A0A2D4J6W4_MICLE
MKNRCSEPPNALFAYLKSCSSFYLSSYKTSVDLRKLQCLAEFLREHDIPERRTSPSLSVHYLAITPATVLTTLCIQFESEKAEGRRRREKPIYIHNRETKINIHRSKNYIII